MRTAWHAAQECLSLFVLGAVLVVLVHQVARVVAGDPTAAAMVTFPFGLLATGVCFLIWLKVLRRHQRYSRRYRRTPI